MKPISLLLGCLLFIQYSSQAQNREANSISLQEMRVSNDGINKHYVGSNWNWSQAPTDDLTLPGAHTLHLFPCPMGVDTESSKHYYTYKVYISDTGTAEAVSVKGGTCTPGASSGTLIVATKYSHPMGYRVGSASTGIQEAWNDAWVADNGGNGGSTVATAPYIKLMAGTNYAVNASIYLRGRGGILDGAGALLDCYTRDRCIYIGTKQGTPQVNHHKLYNLTGVSEINVDGVQISAVTAAAGLFTFTTATGHPFVAGDAVDCEIYGQNIGSATGGQHFVQTVLSSGLTSTQFQMQYGSSQNTPAGANTFGFCGLLNSFIEDNSDHVALQDVNIIKVGGIGGGVGEFSYGIVNDNDQQFIVERAANRSYSSIRSDENFPMGAFIYERADRGNSGITYVHNSEFTNVNCIQAGGNGLVFTDSVCQGFPVYGVRYFGGLQTASFENIYMESTGGTSNPLYSPNAASQMGYLVQGGQSGIRMMGFFPGGGYTPFFGGKGKSARAYFVVPHGGSNTGSIMYIGYSTPEPGQKIRIQWPSVQTFGVSNLTWDILVNSSGTTNSPYGTGNYALAANVSGACGTNGMCGYIDEQTPLISYTVQSGAATWSPNMWFWPGNVAINNTTIDTDGPVGSVIASQGVKTISVISTQCSSEYGQTYTPILKTCLSTDASGAEGLQGTILNQWDGANNGPVRNAKGRLNFVSGWGIFDAITLGDSNYLKTTATPRNRPVGDSGDAAIGVDRPCCGPYGLSLRAGASITSYINVVPNGTNFLERLTATKKTFNVPVTINGRLNQGSLGDFAGKCSMSSSISCSFQLKDTSMGDLICIPAAQGSVPLTASCSVSGTKVTVTAATPNSEVWGAVLIGTSK